ncbi:MAG TPA: hypothetical protein VKU82_12140, partial [Planctomycetaceae bacterium]|nr:hypothetical protein [Planctomycetaceae bacterium]
MSSASRLNSDQSLAEFLDRGEAVTLPEAVEIARQLAAAVALMHRSGRTHGTIVPAAVRLDAQRRATLEPPEMAGRGSRAPADREWVPPELRQSVPARLIARFEGAASTGEQVLPPRPDSSGEIEVDPRRSDVYALGAIFCRLVTGKSADAFLRSPRVKGCVPEPLQTLFERSLGAGSAER